MVGTSCCQHSKSSRPVQTIGCPGEPRVPVQSGKLGSASDFFLLSVHGLGFAAICLLWLYRVRDGVRPGLLSGNEAAHNYALLLSFPCAQQWGITQCAAALDHWHRGTLTSLCVHVCSYLVIHHVLWRRALSEYAFKVLEMQRFKWVAQWYSQSHKTAQAGGRRRIRSFKPYSQCLL